MYINNSCQQCNLQFIFPKYHYYSPNINFKTTLCKLLLKQITIMQDKTQYLQTQLFH